MNEKAFAIIPQEVLAAVRDDRISTRDLAVFAAIAAECGGFDSCIASQPQFARAIGFHRNMVHESVKSLIAAGLLFTEPGAGRALRYYPLRTAPRGVLNSTPTSAKQHLDKGYTPQEGGKQHPQQGYTGIEGMTALPEVQQMHPQQCYIAPPQVPLSTPSSELSIRDQEYEEIEHRENIIAGGNGEDDLFEDSSGDTPDTPTLSGALFAAFGDRAPDAIPWKLIREFVPVSWTRQDKELADRIKLFEDDVIHNPDHPWFGAMLLRSPETIGGWKIVPDLDYWQPSQD